MKANELRIGNLIYCNEKIVKINSEVLYQGVECESFKPIPLTEEWLLKFGISKWILGNRFEVRANEAYSISIYAWQNGICIFICHLDFVHQFQNWYYLHSKFEELTYENKS